MDKIQQQYSSAEPASVSKEALEKAYHVLFQRKEKAKVVRNLPEIPRSSRGDILKNLRSAYRREDLVLVLGAGVSMGYGLPSWDDLLQKLIATTIEKEQDTSNVLAKLFNSIFAPDPLVAGRYLQEFYHGQGSSFEEAVRNVLYATCDYSRPSKLMDEIVNFCVAAGKSPNLNSIITYNFDDILEHKLDEVGIEIPYLPIHGVGMNPRNGELPIYHVHGYLPISGEISGHNQITFGENIYHEQYNDIYSWNNITQINKFRDNTCIFIGSSLTDPNIRRLLDTARLQKGESKDYHYTFKKKYSEERTKKQLIALLNANEGLEDEKSNMGMNLEEIVRLLNKIIERFEENDSASFGVKTIWIKDFSEIPKILSDIRK